MNDREGFVWETTYLIFGVSILVLCLLGMIGNVMSVWIFTRPMMRSPINTLLCGLSLLDFALLLLAIPNISLPNILRSNMLAIDEHLMTKLFILSTKVFYPLMLTAQTSSIWTFLLISVERYTAVCKPFRSAQWATKRKAMVSNVGVVAAAVAYNLCRFWEYESVRTVAEDGTMTETMRPLLRGMDAYFVAYLTTAYLLTHFLIPFLVLLILNVCILRALRQDQLLRGSVRGKIGGGGGNSSSTTSTSVSKRHRRRRSNTTVMIVIVTAIFVLSNVLPFLLNILELIKPDLFSDKRTMFWAMGFLNVSNLLVVLNSASTFAIYLKFCQRYRLLFCSAFCRLCGRGGKDGLGGNNGETDIDGYASVARSRLSSAAFSEVYKIRRMTGTSQCSNMSNSAATAGGNGISLGILASGYKFPSIGKAVKFGRQSSVINIRMSEAVTAAKLNNNNSNDNNFNMMRNSSNFHSSKNSVDSSVGASSNNVSTIINLTSKLSQQSLHHQAFFSSQIIQQQQPTTTVDAGGAPKTRPLFLKRREQQQQQRSDSLPIAVSSSGLLLRR